MTIRPHASSRPSPTACTSGNASLYSKHCRLCNPRPSPSFSRSLVTRQCGMQVEDIAPGRNKRSGYATTKTRIAPATGQLTHNHR
jgi:hypothetical protein